MKWWKLKCGMMPTTAHRWSRFLHYIPRLGHSLRSQVQLLLCKFDYCMNVIDKKKEAASYRKFGNIAAEGNFQWEGRKLQENWNRLLHKGIDREKRPWVIEIVKYHLLKTINRKKDCKLQEVWRYRLLKKSDSGKRP